MSEDSRRMLHNEMEKSLSATLVAAVELFSFVRNFKKNDKRWLERSK